MMRRTETIRGRFMPHIGIYCFLFFYIKSTMNKVIITNVLYSHKYRINIEVDTGHV